MRIREKFKRKVIELIHGVTYKEAIKKDNVFSHNRKVNYMGGDGCEPVYIANNITIGRVMKAAKDKLEYFNMDYMGGMLIIDIIDEDFLFQWKLTKENGQECTDDDQTDKTIEKLYKLIDNN